MAKRGNKKRTLRGEPALVEALARGESVAEAAKAAGIGLRTAHRWLVEKSELRRQVATVRADMLALAAGSLAANCGAAVTALRGLLKAKSEQCRLGAARAILEMATRLREAVELEDRIRALEQPAPPPAPIVDARDRLAGIAARLGIHAENANGDSHAN